MPSPSNSASLLTPLNHLTVIRPSFFIGAKNYNSVFLTKTMYNGSEMRAVSIDMWSARSRQSRYEDAPGVENGLKSPPCPLYLFTKKIIIVGQILLRINNETESNYISYIFLFSHWNSLCNFVSYVWLSSNLINLLTLLNHLTATSM
jgi:hypothetical protein